MNQFYLITFILIILFQNLYCYNDKENDSENDVIICDIPNQIVSGYCSVISDCKEYQNIRNFLNMTMERLNFLKRIQCRIQNSNIPKICCPQNNLPYEIPEIQLTKSNRTSRSRFNRIKKIVSTNDQISSGSIPQIDTTITYNQDDCGQQVVNRIYGGEIAELDEFPWMALLVYNTSILNEFGCGGALIHKRYVLTAAHCVSGKIFDDRKGLKSVRLGEYNTNTEPDCIEEQNFLDCADAAIDVGVQDIIVHPKYDGNSHDKEHDIALIKLERNIQFTHFIMPICLPDTNETLNDPIKPGYLLSVAGWGRTDLFNRFRYNIPSPIKLKLQVPIVSRENCSRVLHPYGVKIGLKQICAGGQYFKDTCLGDSGGPLMYFDRNQLRWVTYGVVSYGFTECGVKGHPAIYTNVHEYIDWITEVISS